MSAKGSSNGGGISDRATADVKNRSRGADKLTGNPPDTRPNGRNRGVGRDRGNVRTPRRTFRFFNRATEKRSSLFIENKIISSIRGGATTAIGLPSGAFNTKSTSTIRGPPRDTLGARGPRRARNSRRSSS